MDLMDVLIIFHQYATEYLSYTSFLNLIINNRFVIKLVR